MTDPSAAKRLLIIDDDEDLRDIFERYMAKEGFSVSSAEDGLKGLARIAVFKPDLIVLDLMMPNLNGFEVLHKMQQEKINVPVIVVTGFSQSANEQIIRQEPNVVEFVKKPIQYKELTVLIKKVLRV
ncbi:MAG: hypothetical protein A3J74_11295 [Elusimicrobia bacterium RIFCSPHIGHO2_02_FULL_57_9]|nr:MAG: hypothetical protein A3J74_11295 [Elusimicrobia bacterium RIFCSPHIGHO2_02_FULL_57_9]